MTENNSFHLDESLGYWIAMAEIVTKRTLYSQLQKCSEPLTPEQWNIMNRLWESDGRNQKELAESLLKDMANVTRILSVMERRELIERIKDPEDGRSHRIYLTFKGKEIQAEVILQAQIAIEKCMEDISLEEQDQMIRLLKKVISNLK